MIPVRLVLINFSCHERSEVDFTQFSASLIVGSVEGNDLKSNGTGKSTIFKGIEYVLFNESDEGLEKYIRDNTSSCKVILYFKSNNELYRLSRSRNKKNASDISLYKRTSMDADDSAIFTDVVDKDSVIWKDISSRRASDTEKDVEKLLKTNLKTFRNTCHFVQHDFSGISTLTPEKRKSLLKDVLQLASYSKLEKIAKDELNDFSKEIIKSKTLLDSIGDPEKDIPVFEDQSKIIFDKITNQNKDLLKNSTLLEEVSNNINELSNKLSAFDSQNVLLRQKESLLKNETSKISSIMNDYLGKKQIIGSAAKSLNENLKSLKERKMAISEINFNDLALFESELTSTSEFILTNQVDINKLNQELSELKIPMPDDPMCKHCRQPLTDEHKELCKNQINERIIEIEKIIKDKLAQLKTSNAKKQDIVSKINGLNAVIKESSLIDDKISSIQKEMSDKKQLFDDYSKIITESKSSLSDKASELEQIRLDLEKSNTEEVLKLKSEIDLNRKNKEYINNVISSLSRGISDNQSQSAVIAHKIQQANENIAKKSEISKKYIDLESEAQIYPLVIQAFSSYGIPSLIIQSVLEDWQNESNNLLSELRPGLQLSFYTEKEKTDGTQADTLEIKYYLNNMDREYGQLSGAQKVAVLFSLKLGLAFLLQKMFDSDIRLLCLDEVDSALDKAGVDAFAEIVKFFSKDFTVLVITHNDRLKDKFSHAILVEQDQNMISKIKQISW